MCGNAARMTDFAKIERAAVLGCALLKPDSGQNDRAAFLAAMAQLEGRTDDSVQVLIAMKLLQGSPCQMMTYDAERTKKAMTLAMHLGGSWVEKGKGTDSSLRQIVLLPPPPR
jgi:hypothetical protein